MKMGLHIGILATLFVSEVKSAACDAGSNVTGSGLCTMCDDTTTF